MPFTLSHAAAAAPLARYGFVLSALVIGSFSPDFIYFIRLSPIGHFTHTIPGVFLFCLPSGMAVLWIYHRLLKEPLAALLPDPLRHSLIDPHRPFDFLPVRRMTALAISITMGAFTHLAWDSFTHEGGAVSRVLPFLSMGVIDLGFEWVPLTRILHHAGSLIGLAWIAFQAKRWVCRVRAESNRGVLGRRDILRSGCVFFLLLTGSAVLGAIYALEQGLPVHGIDELRRVMIHALVASGAFLSALLAAYGILWRITQRA